MSKVRPKKFSFTKENKRLLKTTYTVPIEWVNTVNSQKKKTNYILTLRSTITGMYPNIRLGLIPPQSVTP